MVSYEAINFRCNTDQGQQCVAGQHRRMYPTYSLNPPRNYAFGSLPATPSKHPLSYPRTAAHISLSKFGIVQAACREALKELFPAERDGGPPSEAPSTPKMILTPTKPLENSVHPGQREDLRKSAHGRSAITPFAHNPVSSIQPPYKD